MSLQIIKAGILDTIQDGGRYGYQHLGINPGGGMDRYAQRLGNALLGKDLNAPVIEMHFPASQILFEERMIICLTGADLSARINGQRIPLSQPVAINTNTVLSFEKIISGARCYLSFLDEPDLIMWLGSHSTNLKAQAGGINGRALKKGDRINFKKVFDPESLLAGKDFLILPWRVNEDIKNATMVRLIKGQEWNWLTEDSKTHFKNEAYTISNSSDRMGYRLKGNALATNTTEQLISSPVTFGTVQLLPDGQLIILMADHQTTGGYPRIGNVISIDLPVLAQKNPGDKIMFVEATQLFAEQELAAQQKHLLHLQAASKMKIEKFLNVTR